MNTQTTSELFWNSYELKQLHIELTNACNAACPMCVRFFGNSPLVRPDLEIGQITLEKFKQYFPPHVLKKCELILFCGVHGDPGTARDLYEICEYIDSVSKAAVRVNTNGGMRKSEWWAKLGKLFSKHPMNSPNHWCVTFSIDGLEDTNHIYRRNVNWKTLMENVSAYIQNGGAAYWDYLIFKHNEHQIHEAKQLAEKLNFAEFIPKKALGVDDGTRLKPMPVVDKNGDLEYVIEAPLNPKNRNLEDPSGSEPLVFYPFSVENYRKLKAEKSIGKDFQGEVDKVYEERIFKQNNTKYNHCKISCKSKNKENSKEVFVDNFGRVMPCCYIGTHLNGVYTDTRTLQLHKHMNDYGWDKFDLNKYSLEEILDSGHLDRVFADSWKIDRVEEGRLSYCADTCGNYSSIDKIFTHEINDKSKERKKWQQLNETGK